MPSPSAWTRLRRICGSCQTGWIRMLRAVGMNLPIRDATWPSRVSRSTRQTDIGCPAARVACAIEPPSRIDAVDLPDPPLLDVTAMVTWPGSFGWLSSSTDAALG